jgi:Ca2+-binding RTX toxin-like protein
MARSIVAVLVLAAVLTPLGGAQTSAGAPPKANGRIAFAVDTGIASMNPDGSGQWGGRTVLPGDTQPAWSPDGTKLAVVMNWQGTAGIRIDNPDGGTITMLTHDGGDNGPAWSPDGTRLAFLSYGRLMMINADGSGRQALPGGPGPVGWAPSWSPDGSKIAYQSYVAPGSRLFILDLASGTTTQVPTAPGNDWAPAWSPDGSELAFSSDSGGPTAIWVVHPDGSGEQRLSAPAEYSYDAAPAWSPDGATIAFVRRGDIWSMNRDGSGPQQLTTTGRSNYTAPTWQPLDPAPAGCTLWGTAAPDLLVGSEHADVICGLDGNDTIIGLGGSDRLDGGPGNDWLAGGQGIDLMLGGPGRDRIDARDGGSDTVIAGGDAGDYALYDKGLDTVYGVQKKQVSHNIAVWRTTTASSWSPTNPPARAVDGRTDDSWNSGGWPPGWIEIDFGHPVDIGRIRLIAGEQPGGKSFLVLTRRSDGTYRLLHRFDGPTVSLQELKFSPRQPWRAVRYLRIATIETNSPSAWVSWPEIEVYPPQPR